MPITPERVAKLRTYGLSEYASRTYLALLDLGTAEARDISGLSKVPASKIYRILEQLHEKGLVEVLPEFPRKYAPVPFGEFLDKLHAEHQGAAAVIAAQRDSLLEMFAIAGDVESTDRGGFTVIRGRRNVMEKLDELARGARRSLFFLATPGCLARRGFLRDLVDPVAQRGAHVRLLLPSAGDLVGQEVSEQVDVRRLHDEEFPLGGAVLVADGQRALVVHFVPDDGDAYDGTDVGVATDQPGVAAILEALVEWPWREAMSVERANRGPPPVARNGRDVPVLPADIER